MGALSNLALMDSLLQRTYLHIPGIGETTERKIWEMGISDWRSFIDAHARGMFERRKIQHCADDVLQSIEQYAEGHWNYFDKMLPSHHKWRAFGEFPGQALYVDIETTGMGSESEITVIGTFNGREVNTFIAGINLEKAVEEIERYPVVVTFNGAVFDMPIIRKHFHYNLFNHIHIDLRFPLKSIGYTGGLKIIETRLGLERSERTRGLDGWDAVRLWSSYRRGNDQALDLLDEYNREDIVHLEPLMQLVYREMSGKILSGLSKLSPYKTKGDYL